MNPLEERTLGSSRSRSEIHFGVERRDAGREEDVRGEEVRVMAGEPGQKLLKLATSRRR